MAYQIPTSSSPWEIRRDDTGIRVWALQRGFNGIGWDLVEDGVFGDQIDNAVRTFQTNRGLTVDGRFGLESSRALAKQFDKMISSVPVGLVRGQIEGESGNWMVAVNTMTPGGIDCGYTQRRVYQSDYSNQDVILRAFDSKYQINLSATRLKNRKEVYLPKSAVNGSEEYAWRLAALYHNWEYGADLLSTTPQNQLSSYWTTVKAADQWPTNVGAMFPNGERVDTPLKWAKFYALGAPNRDWPGAVTKYVESWAT